MKRSEYQKLPFATSETLEFESSLNLLLEQIKTVETDSWRWKWIVIGAHNLLQTMMILALQGTSGDRTYGAKVQKHIHDALEKNRDLPLDQYNYIYALVDVKQKFKDRIIADFITLWERVCDPISARYALSDIVFNPSQETWKHIDVLNEFRNDFIHSQPLYSNNLATLELIVPAQEAVGAVKFLINHYTGYLFLGEQDRLSDIRVKVDFLYEQMTQIKVKYEDMFDRLKNGEKVED